LDGWKVYFGGDLARWVWDDLSAEETTLYLDYYDHLINRLAEEEIDIAFSNADRRIAGWSGAPEFIRTVKPGVFVPMHTFNETHYLEEFGNHMGKTCSNIFLYRQVGDRYTCRTGQEIPSPAEEC
ncbi:MAG: hypothetical protein PHQ23_04380, partial [Candidatus Wallbacteria bacterium]|nr:hypothetical protein [Candidatus Wallbacteria bacterium]